MTTKSMILLRSIMAVSLEVFLVVGFLTLCLFLESTTVNLLGVTLVGICLTSLGCWLYQGGSGSIVYHVLLYPLVAAILYVTYQSFGFFLSILITGLYYLRVHYTVSNRFTEQDYLKRFFLSILLFATCLVYFAIIHVDVVPVFWVLTLLAVTYLLIRWVEYLTREQKERTAFSSRTFQQYAREVVTTQLLLTLGYLISASVVLSALYFLWLAVKTPLRQVLSFVLDPIVAWIMMLMNQLSALFGSNKNVQVVLNNTNQDVEVRTDGLTQAQVPLLERLEPYLIVISILIFVGWLGYLMWVKRAKKNAEGQIKTLQQSNQQLHSLERSTGAFSMTDQFRSLYQRFKSPQTDQVRKQYEQYLRHMASRGLVIENSETPTEFLYRIQSHWSDPDKLLLANQITHLYEQHRYDQHTLSSEEVSQLSHHVEKLRKLN